MQCTRCGHKAVYHQRSSGQKLCEEDFLRYFDKKASRVLLREKVIGRGEKVGVALSGGKDSVTVLNLMAKISEKLDLEVHAIAVDEGIVGYRPPSLVRAELACDILDIPFHVVSFKDFFDTTLDEMMAKGDLGACTYCGVLRRKLLNEKARHLGLDVLATGHNLDDEVQAVMMNYIRGDVARLVRLGKTDGGGNLVKRIKPLREFPEKEVALYALLQGFDVAFDECPYTGNSFRYGVRDFINNLEKENPGIKFSILKGYGKILPLIAGYDGGAISSCEKCGEPSSGSLCKACELTESL